MPSTLGIAMLGAGIFALEEHLPGVANCKLLDLKAVYSRSAKSTKTFAAEAKKLTGKDIDCYNEEDSTNTLDALLARKDIQAVIVALTITGQPEVINKCFAAGKHVLSEKPIAKDIPTAEALITDYKKYSNSLIWSIAENFRFFPEYDYAANEVARLGKVIHFATVNYSNVEAGNKYYETSWRKTPDYNGFILDGGIHTIAGLRLMLGDLTFKSTNAYSSLVRPHLPPIDTLNAILLLSNGAHGTVSYSFGSGIRASKVEVVCENGGVTVSGKTVSVKELGKDEFTKSFDNQKETPVAAEVRVFAETLASGKGVSDPRQTPEEGLEDLKVIDKMIESAHHKGKAIAF